MKKILKTLALSVLLLAPSSLAHAQVSFGIRIGEPPPPRYYRVPARPGPGYEWVEGYWYPNRGRWVWHDGYWTLPPYEGAYWSAPYYYGGQYYAGRWEGSRGYIDHDHRWDRQRDRDGHRERNRDRDHDRDDRREGDRR